MLRVVGAGVGRTGTASLKVALEELLGGPCHHMSEVEQHPGQIPVWAAAARGQIPDWRSFLEDYVALVDWPGAAFWRELSVAFPDALVLLSVREAESWYASASDTILRATDDTVPGWNAMWSAILDRFCNDPEDPASVKTAMEAHNAAVEASIPSDRLLVWQASDGWEPLCRALGVAVPDKAFPHVNTRREYHEKWVGQKNFPGTKDTSS